MATKPSILPDIFTLCKVLNESTSWIDFECHSNTFLYSDSESLSESGSDERESTSADDEEDNEDTEETDQDSTSDSQSDSDDDDDDNDDEEHVDIDPEQLLNDFDNEHLDMRMHGVITTLLRQRQVRLDQLFTRYTDLLRVRRSLSDDDTEEEDTTEYSHSCSVFSQHNTLSIETKEDLFFLIATFTYEPNETYNQNYFNVLKFYVLQYYKFEHLYIDDILSIIVSYIASAFRFCAENNESRYYNKKMDQVTLENNQSIVRFDHMEDDYLNIISESCVLNSSDIKEAEEDHFSVLIHCFMLNKGDEFWLGFIEKNSFSIRRAVERSKGVLLYYGGRESLIPQRESKAYSTWDNGYGAIHQSAEVMKEKLPSYSKGDWISFLIQKREDRLLSIFKNGELVFETLTLPFKIDLDDPESMSELYFMCTVDDSVDAVFVEQAMYNGQIPFALI